MLLINYTSLDDNKILYGGNAGLKKGVTINGENWIVKFPQETSTFKNVGISFTTAPICEFVGSHIYQILGFEAHQTNLGACYNTIFNRNMLVVGCKDFTENGKYTLIDYEAIKNNYSDNLQVKLFELNQSLPKYESSSYSVHTLPIEEIILQFENNEVFKVIPEIKKRFYGMLIVDCLINNNDRNKNNWGLLKNNETGELTIAPVYDNGSSFVSKHTDEKLKRLLNDEKAFENSVLNGMCYYTIDHKLLNFKNFFGLLKEKRLDNDLVEIANEVIPLIEKKMGEIIEFVNSLPEKEQDIEIISKIKKDFFVKSMKMRFDKIIKKII